MILRNKLTMSIMVCSSIISSVLGSTLLLIDRATAEPVKVISWIDSVNHLRLANQIDHDFTFMCPKNGSIAEITGTDLYATSSSICTAAAHMGVIQVATGGIVKIRIKPEAEVYQGSTQYGIESSDNGPPVYNSSFVFLDANDRSLPSRISVEITSDQGF